MTFDPRRRFTDRSAGISSDISSGKLARYATVKRPPSTASKESYSSEDSIDGQNGESSSKGLVLIQDHVYSVYVCASNK